jgi:hypothetical protein
MNLFEVTCNVLQQRTVIEADTEVQARISAIMQAILWFASRALNAEYDVKPMEDWDGIERNL